MVMLAPALAAQILSQIQADLGITDPALLTSYTQLSNAIATAVISYIQTNASISITTIGLSSTVCASPGSPVTGAILTANLAQGGIL